MTDRELLEAAAKAAGLKVQIWDGHSGLMCAVDDLHHGRMWMPLIDDGDALRLAIELGICITPYPIYEQPRHSVVCKQRRKTDTLREANPTEVVEIYGDDPCAATRRAIVRAAAAIGAAIGEKAR